MSEKEKTELAEMMGEFSDSLIHVARFQMYIAAGLDKIDAGKLESFIKLAENSKLHDRPAIKPIYDLAVHMRDMIAIIAAKREAEKALAAPAKEEKEPADV